jgi:hypothetical protein
LLISVHLSGLALLVRKFISGRDDTTARFLNVTEERQRAGGSLDETGKT